MGTGQLLHDKRTRKSVGRSVKAKQLEGCVIGSDDGNRGIALQLLGKDLLPHRQGDDVSIPDGLSATKQGLLQLSRSMRDPDAAQISHLVPVGDPVRNVEMFR